MNPKYFQFKISTGQSKCQWCKKLTKQGQILLQISSSGHVIHVQKGQCDALEEAWQDLNTMIRTELFSLEEQKELLKKP